MEVPRPPTPERGRLRVWGPPYELPANLPLNHESRTPQLGLLEPLVDYTPDV